MDTNKNWVDWKYYDATSPFRFCAVNYTGTFNYTFPNNGLYLFGHCGNASAITTYSTNANRKDLYYNLVMGVGSFYFTCSLLNVHADDTLSIKYSIGQHQNPMCVLFYLGSSVTTGVEVAGIHNSDVYDTSRSYSVNNVTNRVILAINAGVNRQINCSTNVNQYVTDGLSYACVSTINETGNVDITVSGSIGQAPCIIDIQIS